jgi:hypothetical protein
MLRCFIALFIALALSLQTGCQTTERAYTTFSPVKYDDALMVGQMVKFGDNGSYMARTNGTSMLPLLTENTVVVVRPIKFEELEVGMTVAYKNSDGIGVLHQLIRRATPRSWVAKGLNNPYEDRDYVTKENLLGVLYTVLYNEASRLN